MTDTTNSGNLNSSSERRAGTFNGYLMLLVAVVLLGAIAHSLFWINSSDGSIWSVLSLIGRTTGFILVAKGFFMLQPNQAAVVPLFGAFRGTDRSEGLRWVWPWMGKTKMSVRSNNVISDKIKVMAKNRAGRRHRGR